MWVSEYVLKLENVCTRACELHVLCWIKFKMENVNTHRQSVNSAHNNETMDISRYTEIWNAFAHSPHKCQAKESPMRLYANQARWIKTYEWMNEWMNNLNWFVFVYVYFQILILTRHRCTASVVQQKSIRYKHQPSHANGDQLDVAICR